MKTIKFQKKNKCGEILRGRFICPDEINGKLPIVIMLTGDGPKGSNSLSWTNIPPRLLDHGISTLLFDFSGLGNSDGNRKELTLTKGIDDFRIIFDVIKSYDWIDCKNIGIMASSFGACVALYCEDIMNKIKVIGLKSPSVFLPDAYLNEINLDDYYNWIKTGYCETNGYNSDVLFDCFKYNIYLQVSKIKTKCLITHGDKDEIVPYNQSLFLKDLLKGEAELITFKNGDHGYSIGDNWEKMARIFIDFYKKYLA